MKRITLMICFLSLASTAMYAQTGVEREKGTPNSSDSLSMNADSLRMDSIIHALPEVMVKGERPMVKVTDGKLVYDMPQLLEKESTDNVYDALKLIPGVTENNGTLTLAGSTFNVLLNGKHYQMTSEQLNSLLKSLPASRLRHAEVMYTTPARYEVRGTSINLDIAADTSQPETWQGELTGAWNQQHNAKWAERASFLYHKKKLEVDFNYEHDHGNRFHKTHETSLHALDDGSTHDIETYQSSPGRDHAHQWRFGMDYAFSDNHNLSLSYTGSYSTDHMQQTVTGSVEAKNNHHSEETMHDVMLDYRLPIGTRFNVEYTYYNSPSTQELVSTLPTGTLNFNTDEHQRINRWKFHLGQEHKLKKGWSLNYGVRYSFSNDHSWQTFTPTGENTATNPTNSFSRETEDIVNIYAGTSGKIGKKINFEASLAGEYYHSPVWHQWNLYPSFSLTYIPSGSHILQFSLSSDKTFPEYWSVQNFTSYDNGGYNEIVGNPTLKPSSKYQVQLVYVLHHKYQFMAWFNHTDDYFTQTPYQRHDRLTVQYKYLNFDYSQQWGVEASIPQRFGSFLDSRLTVLGVWMREKCSEFYDIPFKRDIAWVMANLRNNFTLVKDHLYFNLDGMIRSKAHQAIYDLPASGYVNIGMKYTFCHKRATLHVFCNDFFETSGIDPVIHYANQNMKMDFSFYRQVGVSFVYKFGGYKAKENKVDTSRFKH
ncbi:MAG: TonB-dependent receptor domain-containing protein [Prevotella sp.]